MVHRRGEDAALLCSPAMRSSFVVLVLALVALLCCSAPAPASAACGIGRYDFSSLSKSDLWALDVDFNEIYYLRLCGTVSHLWCQIQPNTQASQACQVASDGSSTYSIASNDTSKLSWGYVNPNNASQGVTFTSATGSADMCPNNQPRVLNGVITCGTFSEQLQPITEQPQCTYNFQISTPLLCSEEAARQLVEEEKEKKQEQEEELQPRRLRTQEEKARVARSRILALRTQQAKARAAQN